MIEQAFSLAGKVAIVTGGGKGIGKAIGLVFAEAGATVVFAARTKSDIDQAVEQAQAFGVKALAVECDVLEDEHLDKLINTTVNQFGKIDILVNNAGGTAPKPMEAISARSFRRSLEFNLTSAFILSQLALPHLRQSKGCIINIASAAGRLIQPYFTSYGTVKAALIQMSKLMAAELAPDVRVNVISPGSIMTEALQTFVDDNTREMMKALTPMDRLGETSDIALAALYLAAPAAQWVTGKDLQVDGGTENTNLPEKSV